MKDEIIQKPGRDLSRLLRPKSIAVIGGGWSVAVIKQCKRMGFEGELWPVHPTRDEIAGYPCYKSVADLPSAPDATFIGVNRDATLEVVRDLSARGAGGAVCFASGFAEVADGAERTRDLLANAGEMAVLGPNCYGFINYLDGALLWPDQHGGKRVETGVAIIAQSSNIAINLTMQKRGLPLAYVLTAGNQAQTGLSGLADAALDDPRVTALGLHIEGFDDLAKLEAVFAKARAKKIPVVAIKVGTSAAAQAMTMSHTASLSGADALADAFFARVGVARARSLDEFVETLKLLHVLGPSPDATLGSMSCSGGEASLVGDLADANGLDLRPLTEADAVRVKATLSDMVTISNPLDYHTFIWGDGARMQATYAAFLESGYGLSMLVIDIPRDDRCEDNGSYAAIEAALAAGKASGQRFALVSSLPENLPEALTDQVMAAGIAPLMGLESAIRAARHAADIGAAWARPLPAPLALAGEGEALAALDEARSKEALRAIGIPTPKSKVVDTAAETAAAAAEIGFPVVLKGVGDHLLHKTEMGAVAVNLKTAAEVEAAAARMADLNCRFLVEEMAQGVVAELIVGLSRDPQFGLFLTIGAGGILVEILKDSRSLLLPASRDQIREALLSLRIAPILHGYRGKPGGDLEATIDAIARLADHAAAHGDEIEELDINPLMILQNSVVAVDALLRPRKVSHV
ncbi:acetate--CoA ligase family protein [Paracoccus aminophilus]|uniref:Acyl-CoA synthetase (NDP forming) n=1 Tax=Paracoccus aminophilus JCM 7686 TaxID=1367847 RepID=S5YX31_PARAH|nr:acetate--CoA ligase family protein [Paracoccus aminophilus]AGT09776.1 acyl-CoA synthetase (NDP forming) [Paracoccus aminophilus JCM 7686]